MMKLTVLRPHRVPGHASGARGVTVMEVLIVFGLLTLVLTELYQVWRTSTRYSTLVGDRLGALMDGQKVLRGLSDEVRRSRRLLFPLPGAPDASDFWVLDGDGDAVHYGLMPREGGLNSLYRYDSLSGKRKELLTGVRKLWCRVPPIPTGRDPNLLHLHLEVQASRERSVHLVTSLRLVPTDVRCPVNR